MPLVINPDVFMLGIAVGVLALVLLLSLVISYAYDEPTLLFLVIYLAAIAAGLMAAQHWRADAAWLQSLLLVAGPALMSLLLIWLLKKRSSHWLGTASIVGLSVADLGLMGFILAGGLGLIGPDGLSEGTALLGMAWGGLLLGNLCFRAAQTVETASPWKWWLMAGHGAGLAVAVLFLTDVVDAQQAYWPVVLMLLVQVPPVYLSLVWRSRLLNEARLRSAAAGVSDPLTGLATAPVLIERLMRIMARAQQAKAGIASPTSQASNALFLIEVQNWQGLLAELGSEFNEKLLLESAMRLRRSVGDNDMVARLAGGRFAVLAQGLAHKKDISFLATRLVVSGLRIDSPLLPGVELKFRVIVQNLQLSTPLSLVVVQAWLDNLVSHFRAWPSSHRSRSILVVQDVDTVAERFEVDSSY